MNVPGLPPTAFLLAWLLAGAPAFAEPVSPPDLTDLLIQLERNPIGPDEEMRITKLVESPDLSGLLVQVRGSLPPHFHKHTQEIVYLLRGEGMFQLGADRIPIRTGAVMRIPAGQVHTFTNTGQTPAVFFVVTTPRWDEQDRFIVKE
jgi:mannose-6-phosphate isomerase-like protein (cupin superfamily)